MLAEDEQTASALLTRQADAFCIIASKLSTTDLLACACTSVTLRRLSEDVLLRCAALRLEGAAVVPQELLWLAKRRMAGRTVEMDVSGCQHLNKQAIVRAVRESPLLTAVMARNVGVGSWACGQLRALANAAPSRLLRGHVCLDCRIVVNREISHTSTLPTLLALPCIALHRIVLINVLTVDALPTAPVLGAELPLPGTAATAAPTIGVAPTATTTDADTDTVEAGAGVAPSPFDMLADVLISRGMPRELDASSGALGAEGVERLLAPILTSEKCALELLACSALPRGSAATLAAAVGRNATLRTLKLGCNVLDRSASALLAEAIHFHPSLTTLTLEHNPVLDEGAAALAATLQFNRIATLTLAFTGAGDATCVSAARAIADRRPLTALSLCGNSVGPAGVGALADALEVAGRWHGGLRQLSLSANHLIDGSAITCLARVLPASQLSVLELCGCGVSSHTCGLLASALPASVLSSLDLSSNHFGDIGAWGLAWALPESSAMRTLKVSDCEIGDDGADELRDALHTSPLLTALDLRGNRISVNHGIAADSRVALNFQRAGGPAATGALGK